VFLKYKPDILFVDIIKKMLVYAPSKRISALEALQEAYFDDLRDENFGDDKVVPDLFNMTPEEILLYGMNEIKRIVPPWHGKKKKD
jgi:glycogen synthase kinase 3 beta